MSACQSDSSFEEADNTLFAPPKFVDHVVPYQLGG